MLLLDRFSYRTLQWLVAAFALLHNLEEALTIPVYAPTVRQRLSGLVPTSMVAAHDLSWLYVALGLATVAPAAVVLVATTGQPGRAKAWAVAFVQSLFLVNAFVPHIPGALVLGGYAPGLATAVLVNVPYSIYFLQRSVRERAVSRAGAILALGLAAPVLITGLGLLYVLVCSLVELDAAPN